MKKIVVLLALLPLLFSCSKKKDEKDKADFETLMGKGTERWQFVQTPEDFENLAFFKNIYERSLPLIEEKSIAQRIPKTIHFIWIGPKPFPRESIENVRSWVAKHPDWTFKFWTDRDRPVPHPKLQKCFIQDLKFARLFDCYNKSDNYGEKSDVLRYEILFAEGGIYVDHDVKCFKSFQPLNSSLDLFIGMEMPYKTALSSSVLPTNNIVASKAGHPILERCMEWLALKWDQLDRDYPGKDRDAVINRVAHRTFLALGESFKELAGKKGSRDVAFPAFYFNAPRDDLAIYSRHLYGGTWFENENPFEKMVRERLMKITKKTNKILLFFGVITFLNVIGFTLLFLKYRKSLRRA